MVRCEATHTGRRHTGGKAPLPSSSSLSPRLTKGLGQLTDGSWGLDDFLHSRVYSMWPGYDYLGWSNRSFPRGYVEAVFQFDHVRNFTSMKVVRGAGPRGAGLNPSLETDGQVTLLHPPQVHCNNLFSRGVRMFRQASCFFRSGPDWEADPVTFRPTVDRVSQSARFVTVPLRDRTASAIKCRFHFGDQWMLFSEVAFQSGGAGGGEWASATHRAPPCKRLSLSLSQARPCTTHL